MKLLSEIHIPQQGRNAVIQLLEGDLTAIPKDHAADIVVVSAFPGNYDPVPGTLIGTYFKKGLDVSKLALDNEINLVDQLGCWLSKPLSAVQQDQFHFTRLLCFEPKVRSDEQETVVGNIFRCINSFAFDDENRVVALPILASGNQKVPMERILPAVLAASIFWLENGLPLDCIKLVLHDDEQVMRAVPLFSLAKSDFESKSGQYKHFAKTSLKSIEPGYDLFISYAHTHASVVNKFVQYVLEQDRNLRVFYDKSSIPPGGLWIKEISDAIQKSGKVLVFLSPDYSNSPVCWDEFQCAKLIEYNRKTQIIRTIYLHDFKQTEMPPIMGIYSWIDCREGDENKLQQCVSQLIN